jgi:hypothetical protein
MHCLTKSSVFNFANFHFASQVPSLTFKRYDNRVDYLTKLTLYKEPISIDGISFKFQLNKENQQ